MTGGRDGETEGAGHVPTDAGDHDRASPALEPGLPTTQHTRDDSMSPTDVEDDDDVDPGVVPEDAPRGGTTVPMPNNTGMTTPPIGGWGEAPVTDDDEPGA